MGTIFNAFLDKGKYVLIFSPIYYVASIIAPIEIQFIIRCIQNVQNGSPDQSFFQSQIFGYVLCAIVLLV